MWWVLLLGCGPTPGERQALEAAKERLVALDGRITKLENAHPARRSRPTTRPDSPPARPAVADARTLREILADPNSFSRHGIALLHRDAEGEYDGYRLSAVRRGGIANRLGIKNGDILHSVNGQPLHSLDHVKRVYETIGPQTKTLEVRLTRRGEQMVLTLPLDGSPPSPSVPAE